MYKVSNLQSGVLTILILTTIVITHSQAAWKKKYNMIEFSFSWATPKYKSDIKFRIPTIEVVNSYNKIKPVKGSNAEKIKIMEELYVHGDKKGQIRLELERFVEEDSKTLKVLSTALIVSAPIKSPRGLASHALSFVQSVPYSTNFKTGTTSLTPIGVLVENVGDCDSKSSLLVAILNGMSIEARLLDIPGHMMVGISIPIEDNEAYFLDIDDKKYLVAETTIINLPMGVWDKNHFGKPVKAIKPYKAKPPKLSD